MSTRAENSKSKFFYIAAIILAIGASYYAFVEKNSSFSTSILGQSNKIENQAPTENNRAVAMIGDTKVYKSEINQRIKDMFQGNMPEGKTDLDQYDATTQETFVRGIVTSKALSEEAKKANIQNSEQYKKQLDLIKDQLAQRMVIDQAITERSTDAKLQEMYKQFAEENSKKEEFKARHILVSSEEEAKSIVASIRSGADFAETAKNKSSDSSKNSGGDLGYFSSGQMVKPFEDAIKSMKVGDISEPVKTDFGWHVIKLEDKRAKI